VNRIARTLAEEVLRKGPENKIEPIAGAKAVRAVLRNVLFFAREPDFVEMVFDAAFDFVDRVPIRRLTFTPTFRVWEMFLETLHLCGS
jgi:hypothetical protein